MAGAEYEEKRGPNPGSRSVVRHGTEGGVTAGGLALVLQALVDYGSIDIKQAFVALAVLTPIVTTALKAWASLGATARLRGWLDKRFPAGGPPTAILAALAMLPLLSGCALQVGTMEPKQFSTLGGGTLIACETKGFLIAIGDSDLCSNSARGGKVSKTFSDMTLGVVATVGKIIAGFFGGAGAGVQAAMAPSVGGAAPAAESTTSPPATPAPTVSPVLDNPFTAPE